MPTTPERKNVFQFKPKQEPRADQQASLLRGLRDLDLEAFFADLPKFEISSLGMPKSNFGMPKSKVAPMADDALTDAKIDAAEARTDSKFERLMGELKTMNEKFGGEFKVLNERLNGIDSHVSSTKTNIWAAAGVVVAALALALGVALVVGPWAFGFGTQLRDIVKDEVKQVQTMPAQPPKQR